VSLGSTTVGTATAGALKVTGGVRAGNLHITGSSAVSVLSETSLTYNTGFNTSATGAYSLSFAVTALNAFGETLGTASSVRYYYAPTSGTTSHTATVTWSAVSGATSYKVYRKTFSPATWFLVETVPAANTRTHTTTFANARTTNFSTANASAGGIYGQNGSTYFYLSTALSPVNGTSSGSANTPKTSNTTVIFPVEVVGTISATSLRLSAATPLLNSSGTALEFVPKYDVSVFTGDGTNQIFTLGYSPLENEIFVTVAGVPQTPGSSYAYYTTQNFIVFTEAPNPADRIVVRSLIMKVRGS